MVKHGRVEIGVIKKENSLTQGMSQKYYHHGCRIYANFLNVKILISKQACCSFANKWEIHQYSYG